MDPKTIPVRPDGAASTWAKRRCARCGSTFSCGADTPSCWCDGITLSDDQRTRLAELQLDGCLCRACLEAL